jgi:hypothetical protein
VASAREPAVRSNALLGRATPPAKQSSKPGKRTWSGRTLDVSDEGRIADANSVLNRVGDVPCKTGPIIACDAFVVPPVVIPGVGPPVPKRKGRRDRVGKLAAQRKYLPVNVVIPLRDRIEVARILRSGILPEGRGDDPCCLALRSGCGLNVHPVLCLTREAPGSAIRGAVTQRNG